MADNFFASEYVALVLVAPSLFFRDWCPYHRIGLASTQASGCAQSRLKTGSL